MRKKWIGGNWKMQNTRNHMADLSMDLLKAGPVTKRITVVVFPSFVHIASAGMILHHSSILIGAQNHSEHEHGAFTGEVSASMLREVGCDYVLLGHSERRHIFLETNACVAAKVRLAVNHGLKPVICVGETELERKQNLTETVIAAQLDAVLAKVALSELTEAVIAYEPVWAIGTGHVATPDQAQTVHQFIRAYLAKADASIAAAITIVYGGSVKSENAAAIFSMPDIDGGLIGGASLKSQEFLAILDFYAQ